MMMSRPNAGAGELETFAMANCLMLLNNQAAAATTNHTRGRILLDEGTWFPCKTCGRKFPSFQALGGHRASHKKTKPSLSDNAQLNLTLPSDKPRTHVCTICGAHFPLGQALGGHMRRHRQTPGSAETTTEPGASDVTHDDSDKRKLKEEVNDSGDNKKRKLGEEVTATGMVRNLRRLNSNKRVCLGDLDLDLNLYLWNGKYGENGDHESDEVEVHDDGMDFLKLELRQPIN